MLYRLAIRMTERTRMPMPMLQIFSTAKPPKKFLNLPANSASIQTYERNWKRFHLSRKFYKIFFVFGEFLISLDWETHLLQLSVATDMMEL